jgi:hypothetical protein
MLFPKPPKSEPKAKKRIRQKRAKPRRGKETPEEKAAVRLAVYQRAAGRCELQIVSDCIKGVLPLTGCNPWDHAHAVHLKSAGSGGKWTMDNIRLGCHRCHLIGMHNSLGKPCPPKQSKGAHE